MQKVIRPATSLRGSLALPGDKSISHRYAILASLAEGTSRIHNYSTGADCHSTLGAVRALGIPVEEKGTVVTIHGKGLRGWRVPSVPLDAGNSGSAMRMLAGPLAAQPFESTIIGDESLTGRPMKRILGPLAQMGGSIDARDGNYPPLHVHAAHGPLNAIDYTLPVASAQVKTCILLAGLYADGITVVREPVRSRDHTEIALREFGAEIHVERRNIALSPNATLTGREVLVPADLSSAAFFLVAALLVPGSDLLLQGVGLNPTRSALLDFLVSMGAPVQIVRIEQINGDPIGDIRVKHARVQGGVIEKDLTAAVIDEIPVLAVLGAASAEGLTIRDAAELRVKETDRIATVADNLRRMGMQVTETPDGMHIPGNQTFRAATFDSFGDHRIAMAFAVAALHADGESKLDNAEAASVSFPEFYDLLQQAIAAE
jgi:3-phosphoshikimate 1-carboxyvinyltransferase